MDWWSSLFSSSLPDTSMVLTATTKFPSAFSSLGWWPLVLENFISCFLPFRWLFLLDCFPEPFPAVLVLGAQPGIAPAPRPSPGTAGDNSRRLTPHAISQAAAIINAIYTGTSQCFQRLQLPTERDGLLKAQLRTPALLRNAKLGISRLPGQG